MKTALYIHGFASAYDPQTPKVIQLQQHFNLIEYSYDCGENYQTIISELKKLIADNRVDFIIGTSLGGFYAMQLAEEDSSLLAVALNPAIEPHITLKRRIGETVNIVTNKAFNLSAEAVESYPTDFAKSGNTIVHLWSGDEVLDAQKSHMALSPHFKTILHEGGTHRVDDLSKVLPEVLQRLNNKI